MDEVGRYLQRRWKRLGETEAVFCRPWLEVDAAAARQKLDPNGNLGDVANKDVLCLASGGGQQSVAFGLLGARVTVVDFDSDQLERDRRAAEHHGVTLTTEQGDMRDLSRFPTEAFDIVWHPYSVNFVPEFESVVAGVARVLRPNGIYIVMIANPYAAGVGTSDWNGEGYVLRSPYIDGAEYEFEDEDWVTGGRNDVPRTREFRHTLGKVVNTLVTAGFALIRLDEELERDSSAPGGTWQHLKSVIPPWFTLWARRTSAPS